MKKIKNQKVAARMKIKKRVRKSVIGTLERPRLNVFRSNNQIYAQMIDDSKGHTLVAASSREDEVSSKKGNKTEKAKQVGKLIADRAKDKGIETVVFDRNGYQYHGRVKALAEGAREGGLKF
jgi:large subunit ribosomal protein L18